MASPKVPEVTVRIDRVRKDTPRGNYKLYIEKIVDV